MANHCGFCKTVAVMATDTPEQRIYDCPNCHAQERITKHDNSWWYHGWSHPNGEKLRAPTSAELMQGKHGWQPDEVMRPPDSNTSIQPGDRVKAGIGDDYDTGTVHTVAGNQVVVSWDSGVRTAQQADMLTVMDG